MRITITNEIGGSLILKSDILNHPITDQLHVCTSGNLHLLAMCR